MIIIQFDQGYLKWARPFLKSLAATGETMTVVASTIGLSDSEIAALNADYSPLICHNSPSFEEDPYELPFDSVSKNHLMASRKAFVLEAMMERYGAGAENEQEHEEDYYYLMDLDLYFNKPLTELKKAVSVHDLGMILRLELEENRRLSSSLVAVHKSQKDFVSAWCRKMRQKDPLWGVAPWAWFWDQLSLLACYEENLDRKIYGIESKVYNCLDFDEEAVIWSAGLGSKDRMYRLYWRQLEDQKLDLSLEEIKGYYEEGELDIALVFSRKYLLSHPEDMEGILFFAELSIELKQWQMSIAVLEAVDEKTPLFYKLLGMGYLGLNDREKALRALRIAEKKLPEDTEITALIEEVMKTI